MAPPPPPPTASNTPQQLAVVCFVLDKALLTIFRGTFVFYLRFEERMSDRDSILYYHIFETSVFFSAYIGGVIGLQFFPILQFPTPAVYITGAVVLSMTIAQPYWKFMLLLGLILFGLGHGLMKVVLSRLVHESKDPMVGTIIYTSLFIDSFVLIVFPNFVFTMEGVLVAGFGITVGILAFIGNILSVGQKPTEENYTSIEIITCYMNGLFMLLSSGVEEAIFMSQPKKDAKDKKFKPVEHWLDRCVPKFPAPFVKDLQAKLSLNKFYYVIPFLWIGIELQYSYWMFNTNLLERQIWFFTLIPTQFLAIGPIMLMFIAPLFALIIRPLLRKWRIANPLHIMTYGVIFLVMGVFIAWKVAAYQSLHNIDFHEPTNDMTKVTIFNGIDCNIHFQNNFVIDSQYWKMTEPRALVATIYPDYQTVLETQLKLQVFVNILSPIYENTFLKYTDEDDDEETVGTIVPFDVESADSVSYFVPLKGIKDYEQGVHIKALTVCQKFDQTLLNIGSTQRAKVGTRDLYILRETNDSFEVTKMANFFFERNADLKPGLRFLFVNQANITIFHIYRNGHLKNTINKFDNKYPMFVWLEDGDGHNINIVVDEYQFYLHNFTMRAGALYDVLVLANETMAFLKIIQSAEPVGADGTFILPCYFLVPLGEFFFGIYGMHFLWSQTPKKLRLWVQYEKYLCIAFANFIIVCVTWSDNIIFLYNRHLILILLIILSFPVFIYMTFIHKYNFQPDYAFEQDIVDGKK